MSGCSRRGILSLAAAFGLTGCGFRPVYAPSDSAGQGAAALSQVQVALIPERAGQLLRQSLQERFDRAGGLSSRRFDLQVALAISNDQISIQPNNSPTRVRVIATARWVLLAQDAARRTVTSGTARSVDGYNSIDLQYFYNDLTNDSAVHRVTAALADQIALQLATYLNTHDINV